MRNLYSYTLTNKKLCSGSEWNFLQCFHLFYKNEIKTYKKEYKKEKHRIFLRAWFLSFFSVLHQSELWSCNKNFDCNIVEFLFGRKHKIRLFCEFNFNLFRDNLTVMAWFKDLLKMMVCCRLKIVILADFRRYLLYLRMSDDNMLANTIIISIRTKFIKTIEILYANHLNNIPYYIYISYIKIA